MIGRECTFLQTITIKLFYKQRQKMHTIIRISLIATIGIFLFFSSAVSQTGENNFGLGIIVGEPTGISLKHWQTNNNAIDAGIAWSIDEYDALHLHGDYLWHNFSLFEDVEKGDLPFYYGVGARVIFAETDAVLGARIPVGLNYLFENSSVGIFLEVVPTINLLPDTDFDLNGGVGVRYYF